MSWRKDNLKMCAIFPYLNYISPLSLTLHLPVWLFHLKTFVYTSCVTCVNSEGHYKMQETRALRLELLRCFEAKKLQDLEHMRRWRLHHYVDIKISHWSVSAKTRLVGSSYTFVIYFVFYILWHDLTGHLKKSLQEKYGLMTNQ